MNRIEFLKHGLNCNEIQASIVSELIKNIPNNQLKKFLIFRMNYVEPMKSSELITKTALYEFRRIQTEKRVQAGEKVFQSVEEVAQFVKTYYKSKDLGSGLATYFDYVVIGLDKEGNLINKYVVSEYGGSYLKLDSNEEAKVFKYLFENQNRIGDVKYYSREQVEHERKLIEVRHQEQEKREQAQLENQKNNKTDKRVLEMINKINVKVS